MWFISICVVISIFVMMTIRVFLPTKTTTFPYSKPTVFFIMKAVIFYLLMEFRKRKSNSTAGYGIPSYSDVTLMEQPQKLPPKIKAVDAVFFSGANAKGWSVIIAMERRPKCVSTILAYIKIPGEGIFVPKSHPDCISFREEEDEHKFKSGGLEITMVKPMEKWQLKFSGTLKKADNTDVEKEVDLKLDFTSKWRHFDYDKDMDQWATSKAFAREPWSRKFFDNLKELHQTHYEQMGDLSGTIKLNEIITLINMPAFRDHSYGARREWSQMHRYVFHHIFMDDGSKGVVGVVCQPYTCTRLVCGYWSLPNGEAYPVTEVDLKLEDHGEGGQPPKDYSFQFKSGCIQRTIEVNTEDFAIHYLGWDWEAKMHELFVVYKVNGINGRGICEWEYNNRTGRQNSFTNNDPDWSKALRVEYLTNS